MIDNASKTTLPIHIRIKVACQFIGSKVAPVRKLSTARCQKSNNHIITKVPIMPDTTLPTLAMIIAYFALNLASAIRESASIAIVMNTRNQKL